jgi:hypothetical protein
MSMTQLVYTPTQKVFAEWNDSQIIIHHRPIEWIFMNLTSTIPRHRLSELEGKITLRFSDSKGERFIKVFQERILPAYYPSSRFSIISLEVQDRT